MEIAYVQENMDTIEREDGGKCIETTKGLNNVTANQKLWKKWINELKTYDTNHSVSQ